MTSETEEKIVKALADITERLDNIDSAVWDIEVNVIERIDELEEHLDNKKEEIVDEILG